MALEHDLQLLLLAELLAETLHGGDQAEVLQFWRVELVGQRPNIGGYLHRLFTKLADPAEDFGARIGDAFSEAVEFHGQQPEALIDVIVKVSGNAAAFLLLGINQPGSDLVLG